MQLFDKLVHRLSYPALRLCDRWAYRRFRNHPFGRRPRAREATYRSLWEQARLRRDPEVEVFEAEAGHAIDRDWLDDLALHTQVALKASEVCYAHGRVLYSAVRRFVADHRPGYVNAIETGTARGFSALCLARALSDAGVEGKVLTFDVLPHETTMYWNCVDDERGPRTRAELLEPWRVLVDRYLVFHQGGTEVELPKVKLSRIHVAFFDGAHSRRNVLEEFGAIEGRQRTGDLIVFDDYSPGTFDGVVRAVDVICRTKGYALRVIRARPGRGYAVARKL